MLLPRFSDGDQVIKPVSQVVVSAVNHFTLVGGLSVLPRASVCFPPIVLCDIACGACGPPCRDRGTDRSGRN
jgi:hypothetical protein